MVAVWAEADLVVADEFRDGNVPAKQEPLTCAQLAFAALPGTVERRYFRGDSACHENNLIQWLKHPDRQKEQGGAIGFAISAVMSAGLQREVQKVAEKQWQTIKTEADGTLRQLGRSTLRLRGTREKEGQPAAALRGTAAAPSRRESCLPTARIATTRAVVTNLDWAGARLLQWHREKAGTIEHVHDEVKNALGGGQMPSQRFGVNAAWFKLALMAITL